MIWQGRIQDGQGNCLKARPFPAGWYQGSLNLWTVTGVELHSLVGDARPDTWRHVAWMPVIFPIYLPDFKLDAMMGLDPITRMHEVAARHHLRSKFGVENGDVVNVEIADDLLLTYGNEMD